MKIATKLYEDFGGGELHFIDKGICIAYTTTEKGTEIETDHVTFRLGKYRLHLNRKDFRRFCKKFLYNGNKGKQNALVLR